MTPIDPYSKIKGLEELKTIAEGLRASGRKIVFANGCFDLLHVGHTRYLQGAKRLGDALILGINSDDSIAKLKGPGRPLQPEADRVEMLASLECVDYVLLFHEPTAHNILKELQPHIHAKGTDYTEETVPERNAVLAYGGRVAIVGDPKDHSTRDLIKIILRSQEPGTRNRSELH